MNKVTKLSEKELQGLREIQEKNNNIVMSLGQLEVNKVILDNQKTSLLEQLSGLQESQNTLAEELQEKYGVGNINIESGEFTAVE